MTNEPKHIIIIIADSLRYDSVHNNYSEIGLPYATANGITFTEARAAGCWTLPATASIFTGMLPHEHGATAQTRGIKTDIPTLATQLKTKGYRTVQVTANVATTHIFGLHRGFDEVRRIWKQVEPKFNIVQQILAVVGKPRLRERIFSTDFIARKVSEDLEATRTWLQYTHVDVFEEARNIIKESDAKGEKVFLFLNLMETHFPYHIAPTFKLSSGGLIQKVEETVALFHQVNQSFLIKGALDINDRLLDVLKSRQVAAYQNIAPVVDEFCREMHAEQGNLVAFGADHGENFGEHGWTYHFSNITDAGNKVPLFYLPHDHTPARTEHTPVSTRHLYDTILQTVGIETPGASLLKNPEQSSTILSSYWYNNHGKTHAKFKYNQICFVHGSERFLFRNGEWSVAPFKENDTNEPNYIAFNEGANFNPLYDLSIEPSRKQHFLKILKDYEAFASKIKF